VLDTPVEVQKIYTKKMMSKSGIERMKMGSSMFDTAKAIALTSFPNNISEKEKKILLLKRFYGNDFSSEQIDEICKNF